MTSFTFTAEQLRLAPPEVRRWAVREIAQSLAAAERPSHDPSQVRAAALAACTEEEALHVFTMIRSNFVITQVFFELTRDAAPGARVPPLHPLNTGDILRHTRLAHGDGLLECFNVINEAFRQIRGAAEATLFGFDSHGHVYIHEGTHLSIRRLFEELVRPVPTAASAQAAERPAANSPAPMVDIRKDSTRQPTATGTAGMSEKSPAGASASTSPKIPAAQPDPSRSVPFAPQAPKTATRMRARRAPSAIAAEKAPVARRKGKPQARSVVGSATRRTGPRKATAKSKSGVGPTPER